MWRCVIVVVLSTYGADVDLLFCVARAQTPERVAEIRAWSMTFCMCVGARECAFMLGGNK